MAINHLRIVGSGLIGTSIALAAASRGRTVELVDVKEDQQELAKDLLEPHLSHSNPDLIVVATPPDSIVETLIAEHRSYPKAILIDVGSVKTKVIQEVERFSGLSSRFIGTHPMAGREIGGAGGAQGDLFQGRAWILVRTQETAKEIVEPVTNLLHDLGATTYEMSASDHDRLMAQISHLPQFLSTALAATLRNQDGLELAGQGLRDMTRLASAETALWREIFELNKQNLTFYLHEYKRKLDELERIVVNNAGVELDSFFENARETRNKISGKHGAKPRSYQRLQIVIEDKPGQLSELFAQCGEIAANIEDLAIEHSPGQLTGLITLAFLPEDADRVFTHLRDKGWKIHRT